MGMKAREVGVRGLPARDVAVSDMGGESSGYFSRCCKSLESFSGSFSERTWGWSEAWAGGRWQRQQHWCGDNEITLVAALVY